MQKKDWYETLNEKMNTEERASWNELIMEIYGLATGCRDYARCARMSSYDETRDRAILAVQELVEYVSRVPSLEGSSEGPHVCQCGGKCQRQAQEGNA